MTDRYIIKFKDVDKSCFWRHCHENIIRTRSFNLEPNMYGCDDLCLLELDPQQVRDIKRMAEVIHIEKDTEVRAIGFQNFKEKHNYGLAKCQSRGSNSKNGFFFAPTTLGHNADVIIIDSGINPNHIEFMDYNGVTRIKKLPGSDKIEAITKLDCLQDENGHGTHVAGTAGGNTVGWARASTIYSARFLNAAGSGSTSNSVLWYQLITQWHINKIENRPTIVSMSYAGPYSKVQNDALWTMYNAGIILVGAAGNDAFEYSFSTPLLMTYLRSSPSTAKGVICVGSCDNNNTVSWFSQYGSRVDVYSPGSDIWSADAFNVTGYKLLSGTSMATPQVSGILATILSNYGKQNNAREINNILIEYFWGKNTNNEYLLPPSIKFNGFNDVLPTTLTVGNYKLTDPAVTVGKLGPVKPEIISKFPPETITNINTFYSFASDSTFDWIDILGLTGTVKLEGPTGDSNFHPDDNVHLVPFQNGFTFKFYNQDKTSIKISSNGYCTFEGKGTQWFNTLLPPDSQTSLGAETDGIFVLWDDLTSTPFGLPSDLRAGIYYYMDSDKFIVTWNKVYVVTNNYNVSNYLTFQLVLYSNNTIRFAYQKIASNITCTVALQQNVNQGTAALVLHYNGDNYDPSHFILASNTSILFNYDGSSTTQYKKLAACNFLAFQRIFNQQSADWKVYGDPNGPGLMNSSLFSS